MTPAWFVLLLTYAAGVALYYSVRFSGGYFRLRVEYRAGEDEQVYELSDRQMDVWILVWPALIFAGVLVELAGIVLRALTRRRE